MSIPTDQGVTGAAAGLSGSEQIRIALAEIVVQGGTATTRQLAEAVQRRLGDKKLLAQGLASLRFFVNRVAVQKGYIQPYDAGNPGWRITRLAASSSSKSQSRPPRARANCRRRSDRRSGLTLISSPTSSSPPTPPKPCATCLSRRSRRSHQASGYPPRNTSSPISCAFGCLSLSTMASIGPGPISATQHWTCSSSMPR